MRFAHIRKALLVAPVVALIGLLVGCPGKPADTGSGDTGTGPAKATEFKVVDSSKTGTIKGKVTFAGDRAALDAEIKKLNDKLMEDMAKSTDKGKCHEDKASPVEKEQQTWRVNKDGGVQNAVVWLRPPEGEFFKVDMSKKTWAPEVVIKQPHCAYVPHAATLFSRYINPDKPGTESKPNWSKDPVQILRITNTAGITHNSSWKGGSSNPGDNKDVPKSEKDDQGGVEITDLKPDYNKPVNISCKVHTWMNANVWVLPHPYSAVTDENGNYEIKNVPLDVPVQIVAWHEAGDWLTKNKAKGDTVKLEDGKSYDFTVSMK